MHTNLLEATSLAITEFFTDCNILDVVYHVYIQLLLNWNQGYRYYPLEEWVDQNNSVLDYVAFPVKVVIYSMDSLVKWLNQ